MSLEIEHTSPETVPLQSAVLCVDCELITSSRSDTCPVCGGHSLMTLSGIIGGSLVDFKGSHLQHQQVYLFELRIDLEVSQLEGSELSQLVEAVSKIVAPKLGRSRASLHMTVEPVVSRTSREFKVA